MRGTTKGPLHRSGGMGLFNFHLIGYRTSVFKVLNSAGLNLQGAFSPKQKMLQGKCWLTSPKTSRMLMR